MGLETESGSYWDNRETGADRAFSLDSVFPERNSCVFRQLERDFFNHLHSTVPKVSSSSAGRTNCFEGSKRLAIYTFCS